MSARLLNHACVLDEAEREADLREYDRIVGLLAAMKDGDLAIETVESVLWVDVAGDPARSAPSVVLLPAPVTPTSTSSGRAATGDQPVGGG